VRCQAYLQSFLFRNVGGFPLQFVTPPSLFVSDRCLFLNNAYMPTQTRIDTQRGAQQRSRSCLSDGRSDLMVRMRNWNVKLLQSPPPSPEENRTPPPPHPQAPPPPQEGKKQPPAFSRGKNVNMPICAISERQTPTRPYGSSSLHNSSPATLTITGLSSTFPASMGQEILALPIETGRPKKSSAQLRLPDFVRANKRGRSQ